MSTVAEVRMWGSRIGAIALADEAQSATFEYAPEFLESGIEVAPLMMPLSRRLYSFPALARQSFQGLPGLVADSLPDKFGNAIIDSWLSSQGRQLNPVQRLCYTGTRGMGALEFLPASGPLLKESSKIEIDKLVQLASDILSDRKQLKASFGAGQRETAARDILRVGTSAGGARAKAVIAWNPTTNEVRSGQVEAGSGFEYWLMKFDGVTGNKDKELDDPQGYGAIEYAYWLMAREAGITMSDCHLFEEGGRRHFMTRRFDRTADGDKIHMQTLGAMAHFDYNQPGAYSYEQAFAVMRQLELPMGDIEEQFRRMAFNIVARNQDDHVKNIAFLMDRSGRWSLSPAYDVTYSYQPGGLWTDNHQMTLNGKRDHFIPDDFQACAKAASLRRGRWKDIIAEVESSVTRWRNFADTAGVLPEHTQKIQGALRLPL